MAGERISRETPLVSLEDESFVATVGNDVAVEVAAASSVVFHRFLLLGRMMDLMVDWLSVAEDEESGT